MDVLFDTYVDEIERINNEIIINGIYKAKTYVNATGVFGALKYGKFDLPVGISSKIVRRGNVKDECFYFLGNLYMEMDMPGCLRLQIVFEM